MRSSSSLSKKPIPSALSTAPEMTAIAETVALSPPKTIQETEVPVVGRTPCGM
jgi:hypothetical protein